MDRADAKILKKLKEDAGTAGSRLSELVNLSVPAVNKRISKLKAEGVIRKTTVITDGKAVGKPVLVFVLVTVNELIDQNPDFREVMKDEDILECYAVSGDYDYILKIAAADIDDFEGKLLRLRKNGVVKSQTLMCLREYKFEAAALPEL
ncbi:MAG: Lrp/AsnC family transcriptional regulator [Lachnospiraceae bacterium]|nr:Lrp/AsnC family transcriptional regulator [Lachnospiraceae bacterium]